MQKATLITVTFIYLGFNMRIKHWQGYGLVDAKKVSKHTNKDGVVTMTIKVSGSHEWGLRRDDTYDCYYWLLSKFDKKVLGYKHILEMKIVYDTYEYINGKEVETCLYKFKYTY